MQVLVENLSELERCLIVTFSVAEIEKEFNKRLQKLAPKIKVPGFRVGKVPTTVIAKKHGVSVRHEMFFDLVQETYPKVLKEQDLDPVAVPNIDITSEEPFSYKAVFEIYPHIDLNELNQLTVEKPVATFTDEDVEQEIEKLRKEYAIWQEASDRAAQDGDQVLLNFSYKLEDTEEWRHEQNVTMVLGAGNLWPEFEAKLYQTRAGDKLEFSLVFPTTHIVKDFGGKKADFMLEVQKVSIAILPTLEECAKKVSGDVASLHKYVHGKLESELEARLLGLFKKSLLSQLGEIKIPLPKIAVNKELDRIKELPYYRSFGDEELFQEAERNVKFSLLLTEVIRLNNIKLPQSFNIDNNQKDSELAKQMQQIRLSFLEVQALKSVQNYVKVVEKPISYNEALR